MAIEEVVVLDLRIAESRFSPDRVLILPSALRRLSTGSIKCSICRHKHRNIVRLLHCKDMVFQAIKRTLERIGIANFLVVEMSLDGVPIDILRPVPPLLDQGRRKHAFLLQFNQPFDHTEPAVEDYNLPRVPEMFGQPKKKTDGLSMLIAIRSWQLLRSVLPFNQLDILHNTPDTIANTVPLIAKGPRLARTVNKPGASKHVGPDRHRLV